MIVLEQSIVASRFDGRLCIYVIEQNGQRWTVTVPKADLDKHGSAPGSRSARRAHLTRAIAAAMLGAPDAPAKGKAHE